MATRSKARKDSKTRDEKLALLNRQIADITDGLWRNKDMNFYDERAFLERVKDRRELIELDSRFKEYGQGIQALSPMIEDDLITNVMLLNLEEPRLFCIPKETSRPARRDIEEINVFLAQSMGRQNPGKILGRGINTDQYMKGVACVEKRWKYPEEPDEEHYRVSMGEDYYDPKDNPAPNKDQSEARDKSRSEFYQNQREHTFQSKLVNMNEMSWWPLLDPSIFIREYQISYTEFQNLEMRTGPQKGMRLKDIDQFVTLGESDSATNGDARTSGRYFDVVIRNHREGDEWICTEWIKSADKDWADGEQYDEYVIPFQRSMYFIIPSGNMNPTATNPHQMYRPPVYSEVVLVYERNYINTLKVALARMQLEDNFMYINGKTISSDVLQQAEAAGFTFEGAGENAGMVLRRSKADSDHIAVMPGEVTAWPFPDIKSLDLRLAQIEFELERVRPNRLQIGQAISAAKEGTATGLRDQKQASQIPSEAHIDFEEAFWEESARAECAAILYWADTSEMTKPFYYTANGKEPVLGKASEPGHEIMIDADKIRNRKFDIMVIKKNETLDEKAQSDLIAYQDFKQQTITKEQLLGRLGHPDPNFQQEELDREEIRLQVKAELAPVRAMMIKTLSSAMIGANIPELPLPVGATPPGGNAPVPPNPNQPDANRMPFAGSVDPNAQPQTVMPGMGG